MDDDVRMQRHLAIQTYQQAGDLLRWCEVLQRQLMRWMCATISIAVAALMLAVFAILR